MPLQTGQVLNNRYRIVKLLGQGGFGAVYRAWDINLNKPCAVKENLTALPEAQRQFQREARVLASLTHPNLPRVIDHFTIAEQGQYLVMDFVEGEDLGSMLLRGERVDFNQAMEWVKQVAEALTYLHTRTPPVVHRDVKPPNIRITPEGKAMLVDFGLFKYDEPSKSTTLGARAITPGYAPPEQYGRGRTDARTDLYALAATLYAMLSAHEPLESVLRMAGNEMPSARQLNPAISPAVSNAIEHAMELEPDHRFNSVEEFMEALQESNATVVMQPVPRAETMVAVSPMTVQAAAPQSTFVQQAPVQADVTYPGPAVGASEPVSKPEKRGWGRPLAIITILLVIGTLLAVTGWYIFSGAEETVDDSADRIQATIDAGAIATTDARRISTTTAKALPMVQQGWKLVFGPIDGRMIHDPNDGYISAVKASVDLRDLTAEASFINPYSPDVGIWDYGFIFRHAGPERHFRLIVRSDRTWFLRNNDGDIDGEIIASGNIPALKIGDKAENYLKLVIEGDRGEFYLNDILVDELDLSARSNSGPVYLVTAVLGADEVQGYETGFREFNVWSAP